MSNNQKNKQGNSVLKDPRSMYAQPPFPLQTQPFPGVSSKMTPVPDCGEESYKGSGKLQGRKALITGGDSGIGRAVAIAYAREGADVAISYLPAEESDAQEVKALIEAEGRKAVLLPGCIQHEEWCKTLVRKAHEELGGLDILLNNAAHQKSVESILDITTEDLDWTMKTNIYATFWITKAALPLLPAGASIIITSSIVAFDSSPNLVDYSMTKAAGYSFTKSMAQQLITKGIRVNAVAPGPVWTPLQISGGQSEENYQKFGKDSLLTRPGQPAELASTYVFLASNDSSAVTGQIYGITCGGRLF